MIFVEKTSVTDTCGVSYTSGSRVVAEDRPGWWWEAR